MNSENLSSLEDFLPFVASPPAELFFFSEEFLILSASVFTDLLLAELFFGDSAGSVFLDGLAAAALAALPLAGGSGRNEKIHDPSANAHSLAKGKKS